MQTQIRGRIMREPKMAGAFYPANKEELSNQLKLLFKKAETKSSPNVKAIIVPHAGYIYSGIVAATGYKLIDKKFKKIIIMGPSHQVPIEGGAYDINKHWKTPLGNIELFKLNNTGIEEHPIAHEFEHSLEVQVPFLQQTLSDFKICPITLGSFPKNLPEEIINSLDEETFIVVSSDLSHYLPYDVAVEKDKKTIKRILSGEKIHPYDACGADCINVLEEVAKKKKWTPKLIDYKNSGDTAGSPFQVVGYACIAYEEK